MAPKFPGNKVDGTYAEATDPRLMLSIPLVLSTNVSAGWNSTSAASSTQEFYVGTRHRVVVPDMSYFSKFYISWNVQTLLASANAAITFSTTDGGTYNFLSSGTSTAAGGEQQSVAATGRFLLGPISLATAARTTSVFIRPVVIFGGTAPTTSAPAFGHSILYLA